MATFFFWLYFGYMTRLVLTQFVAARHAWTQIQRKRLFRVNKNNIRTTESKIKFCNARMYVRGCGMRVDNVTVTHNSSIRFFADGTRNNLSNSNT